MIGTWTGAELASGVNIAAAVLKAGPIADQVKKVKEAVEKKNSYHHDQIFRGIVLTNVPEWVPVALKITPQEMDAKREALITERMTHLEDLDKVVRATLEMKPHTVARSSACRNSEYPSSLGIRSARRLHLHIQHGDASQPACLTDPGRRII